MTFTDAIEEPMRLVFGGDATNRFKRIDSRAAEDKPWEQPKNPFLKPKKPKIEFEDKVAAEKHRKMQEKMAKIKPIDDVLLKLWPITKRSSMAELGDSTTRPGDGSGARLPDYMGGHCGPLGSWRSACSQSYFQGLEGYNHGAGAVVATSSLGVVSIVSLLVVLVLFAARGWRICGARKSRKAVKEESKGFDLEARGCA